MIARLPLFHAALADELKGCYPNLHIVPPYDGGCATIKGTLSIRHEGREIDRFRIKMEVPAEFPKRWPKLWETEGRIPPTLDRHVYPSDHSLCVLLPDEAYLTLSPDISLTGYLDGPVRNYFVSQCCVELGQDWPWGERSHGLEGICEFYAELFGTDDLIKIAKFLLLAFENKFKGHWLCPCGSGEIIRRCHRDVIFNVRGRVPSHRLYTSLKIVVEQLKADREERQAQMLD